jgi:IS5 family transposase
MKKAEVNNKIMLGKIRNKNQLEPFRPILSDITYPYRELALLADTIDRSYFDREFERYRCGNNGRPSAPIRPSGGYLVLKRLYRHGDEALPGEWVGNPYFRYFCGSGFFGHRFPFDSSDFVRFRKRVGEDGIAEIFAYGVKLHGEEVPEKAKFVPSDTTVRENFTTFPTDAEPSEKGTDKCDKIAEKKGIGQRRKFIGESKQLVRDTHNGKHPKRAKRAKKAKKRSKTIAVGQVRGNRIKNIAER